MKERNLQVKISKNFYTLLTLPQNLRRLGLGQATLVPAVIKFSTMNSMLLEK
jgi:hypothetical protein